MMDGSDRFLGIHLIIFKAEHVTIRSTNIVFNYEIKQSKHWRHYCTHCLKADWSGYICCLCVLS